MLKTKPITILALVSLILIFTSQAAFGASVTFRYSHGVPNNIGYDEYNYRRGEKINSEKRDGYQVNDWIERGSSSVTNSPKYKNGIRLATWTNRYDDEYDYGLASAVYLFDVPYRAEAVKIKIQYDGKSGRYSDDEDIAGRLWIKAKNGTESYNPQEGRYTDKTESLYGDTFILPRNKHKEEITISSRDHVNDGVMEIHVIAEGGQLIDVDYIRVEAYTSLPETRIITREYGISRPWYHHTYLYFYAGPVYRFRGDHYIRYIYPSNRHLFEIRSQYGGYLREYHVRHPQVQLHWSGIINFPKIINKNLGRVWINKWTPNHERTRKSYMVFNERSNKPIEVRKLKDQIRIFTERRNQDSKNLEKREWKKDKEKFKYEYRSSSKDKGKKWNDDEDDDREYRRNIRKR